MKKISAVLLLLFSASCILAQNYSYRSNDLWVTNPDSPRWIYDLNEEANITVSFFLYGIPQDGIEISYSVGPEWMDSDMEGSVTLVNGTAVINIGTTDEPGFRDCKLKTEIDGIEYRHHVKVGYEPDKIVPYTSFPDDFEAFWNKATEEAAECPVYVETSYIPEYSSNQVDCYLVKIQVYRKGEFVYGYLTLPKEEGQYPIVFAPPGAGIKPMDPMKHIFYAENGFIRFDMEIHGIRPDLDAATYKEISKAFGDGNNSYLVNGLDKRDSYYMKKVYMGCVRALDYLTSLPEWDGKNLIAQGGSQGGALSLITAGLDDRITACAANHPALSDMAGFMAGRAGGYPHLSKWFSGMDTPEKLKTLEYFDVVNFARLIDVPVFMTWGFNDNTCPPTTSYAVYNVLDCEKEAFITPINEHWVSTETRYKIMHWIQDNLK